MTPSSPARLLGGAPGSGMRDDGGVLRRTFRLALRHPAALSAVVAAAVFANTLPNRPVLDDGWAVLDNPLVRRLDLAGTFGAEYGVAGGATLAGVYRPVTTLTWAAGYAIHGRAPVGFHAVNVLLHAAATALVVLLARRLLSAAAPQRAAAGALGAGLLFAVHPAHVEAVAPIVARADLLAAVGGLGALVLALTPGPRWRLAAAFAALAGGILSKETAAAIPLLYVLVALLVPGAAGLPARPSPAGPGRAALLAVVGRAAVLAAAVLVYFVLRPRAGAIPVEARWFGAHPPAVVASTMTRAIAEYLRILAFPAQLSTDFGYAAKIPIALELGGASALATAIWGAVLLFGVASARRAPLRAVGILWLFAGLAPVLNVVPTGVLMAERLLYLASVGPCIWAGQLPLALRERIPGPRVRAAVAAASALALVLLAGRAVARNADWRTPIALYEAELRSAPRHPVVNNNLAVEYTARGEYRRALERLDVALAEAPFYWRAHVNRALALDGLGDVGGAVAALATASAIAPGEAAPHLHAGAVLARHGDPERALAQLETAERLAPADPRAPVQAARVLAAMGRLPEARERLRRAIALDPKGEEPARLLAELDGR